ncbi:MAG: tetraacyldisaccharide 4'-kinase [Planctomycetales bacterium]|nr:tetraacyldisaccharide 4'-kinase [Planctomycetales bacterium]
MLTGTDFRDIVSGQRRGIVASMLRCVLRLVEIPYRAVVAVRNRSFDCNPSKVHRVDVPVICVGNLTLGGTGKTPVVAWLARWFRDRDIRVSIVSRGYGAKDGGQNDEARELEARLPDVPHLQNSDRVAAATVAVEELETQLILLDDGFQHRRIHRDLNILLVDATEPFGFGHVFPRGTLREPLKNANRADVLLISKCESATEDTLSRIEQRYRELAPDALHLRIRQTPTTLLSASGKELPVSLLSGKKIAALCGIGNPKSFQHTLHSLGAETVAFWEYPDHHEFTRSDLDTIQSRAQTARPDLLVCTHKDLVKLNVDRIAGVQLLALLINVEFISDSGPFEDRLSAIANLIEREPQP